MLELGQEHRFCGIIGLHGQGIARLCCFGVEGHFQQLRDVQTWGCQRQVRHLEFAAVEFALDVVDGSIETLVVVEEIGHLSDGHFAGHDGFLVVRYTSTKDVFRSMISDVTGLPVRISKRRTSCSSLSCFWRSR